MKIATWNVNSVRARLGRVVGWLELRVDQEELHFEFAAQVIKLEHRTGAGV